MPSAAFASDNYAPSRAVPISLGVPLTGSWHGTERTIATPHSGDARRTHWWRLPQTLHVGDTVTLAVDETGQRLGDGFCLVPPTDDFGAADTLRATPGCVPGTVVNAGSQRRITLPYDSPSGTAFLMVYSSIYADDGYTFTVVRIVTRVNPGFTVPSRTSRSLSITAGLRYGDNTPAADGIAARLELKVPGAKTYRRIASGPAIGGSVKLAARLPKRLRGQRVSLRVCAAQPGGSSARCTATLRVRVR